MPEDQSSDLEQEAARLTEQYGAVPPPWSMFPDEHPYSICWRMGAGESYIIVWGHWWKRVPWSHEERIAYFRKWPPPPRFLECLANYLWDLKTWESKGEFDYTPYFNELERLGFGSRSEYERDLEDPRWYDGGPDDD